MKVSQWSLLGVTRKNLGRPLPDNGPLRVVQSVHTLDPLDGGPARNAYELVGQLSSAQRSISTLIWSGRRDDSLVSRQVTGTWFFRQDHPWRWFATLRAELGKAGVAIIHGHYLWSSTVAAAACRRLEVPYILVPHGVFTIYQQRQSRTKKTIFDFLVGRRMFNRAAAIAVASKREADELSLPNPRVLVTGIALASTPQDGAHEPRQPLPGEPVQLLTLSRIAPKKRIDITIQTARALALAGLQVELVIAGSGELKYVNELKVLGNAACADVDSLRIRWVGHLNGADKQDALLGAHFFLLPSDDENFGITITEALSSGIPVLCSEAAAAAQFVTNPLPAGIVYAQPDAARMANDIERVLGSPERWQFLSKNGPSNVATGAGLAHVEGRWNEVFSMALAAQARP